MRRVLSLAALCILALSASASAQRSSGSSYSLSPEIGIDAGITFGLGTPSTTVFALPAQQIRMGFFMSPALSSEPTLGLTSINGGGSTFTVYNFGAGVLYNFSPNRTANQFYVRP